MNTIVEYPAEKTIFRVEKNADNPFVMIDRRPLEKSYLSWKAKGLLAYLLSRPDNWIINFGDLIKRSTDGEHATRAAAKELINAGHIKVTKERNKGKIIKWIYTVYEQPLCENPKVDNLNIEKLNVGKRNINDTKSNNTESTNKGAAPRPPKANDFPSNVLYREVTEKYPKKANWYDVLVFIDKVEQRLGRTPTKDDLFPYYSAWCGNGWNEWAINWLEYAVKGELPKANGNGHKPAGQKSAFDIYEEQQLGGTS